MKRRGFTLIELTLAMAMAAMLALSLYTAMHVAQRARESINAAEPMRAATLAADMIRQDFESVPPPRGVLAGPFNGDHQTAAGGDQDSVSFCGIGTDHPLNDSPLSEGLRRIEFAIRTDVNPPVLVRRVTRNLLAEVEPDPDEEVICRNVRAFSLRYYDGYSWQETWDSTIVQNTLPMMIALTLDVGAEGQPVQHITRMIPMTCAQPVDTASMVAQ